MPFHFSASETPNHLTPSITFYFHWCWEVMTFFSFFIRELNCSTIQPLWGGTTRQLRCQNIDTFVFQEFLWSEPLWLTSRWGLAFRKCVRKTAGTKLGSKSGKTFVVFFSNPAINALLKKWRRVVQKRRACLQRRTQSRKARPWGTEAMCRSSWCPAAALVSTQRCFVHLNPNKSMLQIRNVNVKERKEGSRRGGGNNRIC